MISVMSDDNSAPFIAMTSVIDLLFDSFRPGDIYASVN